MSKVTIVGDVNGNVITQSSNSPEYGWIRLEQNVVQINERGWLKVAKRSTILKGKITDLQAAAYKAGDKLPGKIVVVESLIPFNQESPDRNLKIAGNTGIVCRVDDQPIYRDTFYTTNPEAYDELIQHTNSDEIRDVMTAQKEIDALSSVDNTEVNF